MRYVPMGHDRRKNDKIQQTKNCKNYRKEKIYDKRGGWRVANRLFYSPLTLAIHTLSQVLF